MRSTVVIVCALAAACSLEPNPAFDDPIAEGTSTMGGGTTTSSSGTSESSSASSSSDEGSSSSTDSTGAIQEGCYDGVVVPGELCFEYRSITAGQDAFAVATGDFNGDGNPDALVGNVFAEAEIFYGNGDGAFYGTRLLAGSANASFVSGAAAVDLNDDGRTDAVVSYVAGNTIDVFLSYEDGSFAEPEAYSVAGGPGRMVAADVDGDDFVDIVATNTMSGEVTVLYGRAEGVLEVLPPLPAGAMPSSVAVGDIDDNGLGDIVVASNGEPALNVLLNMDGGNFDAVQFPAPFPLTVLFDDLDGDTRGDLFVSTASQENFVLYGIEGGGFEEEEVWWNWTGRTAFAAASGDFNADDLTDIAWAEGFQGNGGMTWMLAYPDPREPRVFETVLNPLFTFPLDLAVADFNHDGIDDVVLANVSSSVGLGLLLSVP
jgi:hypothetical protein